MPTCHILFTRERAFGLLELVDEAARSLQQVEPLTLLPLELLTTTAPIFDQLFGDLPEGDA